MSAYYASEIFRLDLGKVPLVWGGMDAARLAPEWHNYRLDGVQIHFTENG